MKIITCIILLTTVSIQATTVSLTPTADAFLTGGSANASAGSPSLNYGGAGAMMISGSSATKGEIQTLFKFDLSTAKTVFDTQYGVGNWLINNITLQLGTNFGTQSAQPNNAIFNTINSGLFKIDWLANDTWVEGTGTPSGGTTNGVTYNSLGSLVGVTDETLGTFTYSAVGNTNPPTIPPATYSLGLSSGFLTDATAGNNVSLRAYAGDTTVGYLFNSRTFGTVANQPVLIISAVPEASSMSQFALGIVGFGILLFRKRRQA